MVIFCKQTRLTHVRQNGIRQGDQNLRVALEAEALFSDSALNIQNYYHKNQSRDNQRIAFEQGARSIATLFAPSQFGI